MMKLKQWSAVAAFCLGLLMMASAASAHVTVRPSEVKQGAYEVFTVRVPSETEGTETITVKVAVPDGVNVTRIEPKPGWSYELENDADGIMKAVTWSAEGAGLSVTEFTEFRMSGRVADDAEELIWKAYQTYADGSVAEWVGAPNTDADKPASLTAVLPGTGDAHGGGHDAGAAGAAVDTATDSDNEGSDNLPIILSIAALCVAVLALLLALIRRKK
jgi:uncharacterized protein YcnI